MKRAALLLVAATTAIAAEPPDIKGLRLGITESEAVAAVPGLRCLSSEKLAPTQRACLDGKNSLAGHPARISIRFDDNALTSINVYFTRAAWKDVQTAAAAKFGKPSFNYEGRLLWAIDDHRLTLYCPDDLKRDCYFHLTNQAQLDRFKEQQRKDADARTKDM